MCRSIHESASKCVIHSTSPALPTLLEGRRLCVGDGLTCSDCARERLDQRPKHFADCATYASRQRKVGSRYKRCVISSRTGAASSGRPDSVSG